MFWRIIYNLIAVPLMGFGLVAAALFSAKVRQAVKGRLHEGKNLRRIRAKCDDSLSRILVHCSSAGELESAIPLIEELKNKTNFQVLLSYYSPSAIRRAERVENIVEHFYLPFDSPRRVSRLLSVLEPSLVVFVKHDIWPNFVWTAKDREIPVILVNGNFRPDSARLKPVIRCFNRTVLGSLHSVYAVAEDDANRFKKVGGEHLKVEFPGDTRYDRVKQRALKSKADQGELGDILENKPVAVAGSTWPEDEKLIIEAWKEVNRQIDDAILVLVPHEPTSEHLNHLLKRCNEAELNAELLTDLRPKEEMPNIIIVNKIGILAGLYGLGKIAYVGGAFGKGVHSVIEPAVFGVPVLFGPRYLMSHEARDLLNIKAANSIVKAADIETAFIDALSNGEVSINKGKLATEFVNNRTGVSEFIAKRLTELTGV